MRKYYILTFLFTFFCLILIAVSINFVGNPLAQRQIQLDQLRLNDFNVMRAAMQEFAGTYNRLPFSLKELHNYSKNTTLTDPETGKPYEYHPNPDSSFSLCAIFSTDSIHMNKTATLDMDTTAHPKGYYCLYFSPLIVRPRVVQNTSPGVLGTNPPLNDIWKEATNLPTPLYEATTQTYMATPGAMFVYEMGGYNPVTNAPVSTVNSAEVRSDGTLGAWHATSPLPLALRAPTSVVYASGSAAVAYVIGGEYDDRNHLYSENVYAAHLLSNGTVSSWLPMMQLPASLYEANAVLYNNTIYVIGGWTGASSPQVYYTTIRPDSTIRPWQKTSALPIPLSGSSAALVQQGADNYIYVIGGTTDVYNNNSNITTVYYAKILPDGTLAPWQETEPYPTAVSEQVLDVYHNNNGTYLVSMGGFIQGTWSDSVYTALVHPQGNIDPWVRSNIPLARPIASSTSFLFPSNVGTDVYTIGGGASSDTNGGIPDVYSALIEKFLPPIIQSPQQLNSGKGSN